MKKGYPLFLNLEGEPCLVFGGGKVALRKIQALLKRGAKVTCMSKEFCAPLGRLAKKARHPEGQRPEGSQILRFAQDDGLVLKRIRHERVSLNGARLVIAATSDREFNARVVRECRRRKIWVNVVDDPALCDFTVPAVMEKGPLQIAISTGGASPLFAKRLREELEKAIPESTGKMLERIGKARHLMTRHPEATKWPKDLRSFAPLRMTKGKTSQ